MSLKERLLSSNRTTKQLIVASSDIISICFATFFSLYIADFDFFNLTFSELLRIFWVPFFSVFIFYNFGIYNSVLRFIDFGFIYLMLKAMTVASLLNLVLRYLYLNFLFPFFGDEFINIFTIRDWLIGLFLSILLIFSSRLFANFIFSKKKYEKKVVIFGAGSAGLQLAGALRVSKEMEPVAFVDENRSLHGTYLGGLKVLDPSNLERLSKKGKVDEVLIAIPSASKSILRNLLKDIEKFSLRVRILPGLAELAQGKILVSELKEVDTSDLLGRHEVEANKSLINKNIQDKVVLITGAGGSIGSELSRQAAKNKAKKIILLDSNEYALYSIQKEIEGFKVEVELYAVLASVNNKKRVLEVCKTFQVNTIYHAAAYKHVPLVEENPFEAVFNNIQGTKTCAEAAIEAQVETFVLISTDKAVRPTNIMGATKRFSELILQSMALSANTRMIMVRFGNVIGSSGSAIPLFQQQIKDGGPVTVTHPEVIRYFMSIPEAAELVIQAGAMGKGGDVFVLDMGEPVKIYDLAKRLINLSGMEIKDEKNPNGDIEIIFTGLRPGEKLYEELLIGDNVSATEHKQILRAEEEFLESSELDMHLTSISEAEKNGDVVALRNILKDIVSGFTPEKEIVDVVYLQKNNQS